MAISNISSEATGLILTKCYMEPSGAKGTKTCVNGPGHMTKMRKAYRNRLSSSRVITDDHIAQLYDPKFLAQLVKRVRDSNY